MSLNTNDLLKKGYDLLVEGKDLDTANDLFNTVLNYDKDSLEILFHIASVYQKKGYYALSMILLKHIIRERPNFVEAINNLGFAFKQEQMNDQAREEFKATLKIASEDERYKETLHEYYTNLGSMYVGNGTPDEAIELLDKALQLDPTFHMALWNRALCYLEKGDYAQGFRDYDYGDRIDRTAKRTYKRHEELPTWDGTPGKTVVVYGEQGIGDELMFATMLPDIMKDCKVIFDAHPRLAEMFRLSFPQIPIYGTRKTDNLPWGEFHNIDAKIAVASLGKFYRRKKEDFPKTPYLKADYALVQKYKDQLASISNRPKIGISWQGGTKLTNKNTRYIPLDLWLPIFDVDADFISLQYNPKAYKEVDAFMKDHGAVIHHWPSTLADYDETAGLVANLDLIISVPQSVVHLAGAMGVPTLQLCPKHALWQMGPYGENMPWYGCVENIWQKEPGEWQPVITQAKEKLCSLLQITT
jgi:tetratricopeptide (TPR) repeat protein